MFPHLCRAFCRFLALGVGALALGAPAVLAQKHLFNDGVYLYGQSPQAEQIGQEYLVFRVTQGQIRGAIYYPNSEFNCFSGTVSNNQLTLGIIDPQDQKVYPYPIALTLPSPVASGQIGGSVNLAGYYRLDHLSPNDEKILQTCEHPL